jgi:hypothetical protein
VISDALINVKGDAGFAGRVEARTSMITSTDPTTRATRQRRRRASGGRSGRPRADRSVVLPMVTGLAAVLLLTAIALLTGQETTVSVAIAAVGAIVSAALSHVRGGR